MALFDLFGVDGQILGFADRSRSSCAQELASSMSSAGGRFSTSMMALS